MVRKISSFKAWWPPFRAQGMNPPPFRAYCPCKQQKGWRCEMQQAFGQSQGKPGGLRYHVWPFGGLLCKADLHLRLSGRHFAVRQHGQPVHLVDDGAGRSQPGGPVYRFRGIARRRPPGVRPSDAPLRPARPEQPGTDGGGRSHPADGGLCGGAAGRLGTGSGLFGPEPQVPHHRGTGRGRATCGGAGKAFPICCGSTSVCCAGCSAPTGW